MASSTLGTTWIQIKPSLKGVASNINNEISSAADSGSQKVGSSLKSAFVDAGNTVKSTLSNAFSAVAKVGKVALAGAVAGVTAVAVQATKLYADYEQLAGGVETLFKDSANTVFEYSNKAFKTAQLSSNQYMETVTSFSASLLQSLGGDTQKAADYADQAIIDMADNANKMGTDMERIQDAYQGFAKQNYTMLDNLKLGYGGTKTEMERLLKDAEKISGIKYNIDSFADITQAIHVVQENLGITGTSALEASETVQGSFNAMKSAAQNVLTFFGGGTAMAWDEIFPEFIQTVKDFGKNIIPVVGDVLWNISNVIGELAPIIIEELPKIVDKILPPLLDSATDIFLALVDVFPDLINTVVNSIKTLLADQERIDKVIRGFVDLFAAVAGAAVDIAMAIIPVIPQVISSLVDEIKKPENLGKISAAFGLLVGPKLGLSLGKKLGSTLKSHVGGKISSFFSKDIGETAAGEASSAVGKVTDKITETFQGLGGKIQTILGTLKDVLVSAVETVIEPVKTLLSGLGQAIGGFISGLFTALADPMIAVGAAMFTVAAAAIAAAIVLIGEAVNIVLPTLISLFNNVIIPVANFLVNTVIKIVNTLTTAIIRFTREAFIPLGNFLRDTFVAIVNTVTDSIIRLVNWAINPLINTLAGAVTSILHEVSNLLNGLVTNALNGIKGVVQAVGDGFEKMGWAIRNALDGVSGVVSAFRDLIVAMGAAVVAVVALATHQSINYGGGFAYVTPAATGGKVEGFGTETSDSNLYALSKGEYVIRAAAARKIGYDNLDDLNENGSFRGGNFTQNIVINGYNKDPNELANIISRKIALSQKGVLA